MPLFSAAIAALGADLTSFKVDLLPASSPVIWPNKTPRDEADRVFNDFVQCDICQRWFHCGCLGIKEGDPLLTDDMEFWCPICLAGTSGSGDFNPDACAHPTCSLTKDDVQRFVIERVVGRRPGQNTQWLYLVRWEGYTIAECTWEPLDASSTSEALIRAFLKKARREGLTLSTAKSGSKPILLQEARDGGWV